jgi:hypothetical protein
MDNRKEEITIRDLYPHLSEDQLKEAEENLERYLELVLRIYERIRGDPKAYSAFKSLTASRQNRMMKDKWSNPYYDSKFSKET